MSFLASRYPRRQTRRIMVGSVPVGGGAPITVQSMTITKTADVEGTLVQIYDLKGAGADIVRCTCNDKEAAEGLAHIVPRSPVPIVADIHFHVEMALAALDAGVDCLRLNPGNLRKTEEIKLVARECKDRGVPVRIGVNAGSLDPRLYKKYGGATPEALVESAQIELGLFAEVGFDDVKISVKASNVPLMIEAYRQLSETVDHPLHLGVTEAGPPPAGTIKATAGIATLLAEGIGDTIRYSLTADPVEEAKAGRTLLEALGLRKRTSVDLIACPACGRAEIDVYKVAQEAQAALETRAIPLQVAVMGCVVNGPGEARSADLGIAAGRHRGHLFIQGQIVRVVPEDEMVEALVDEAEKLVKEGFAARLAAADAGAAEEAERDRRELLDVQGADANRADARVELIERRMREAGGSGGAAGGTEGAGGTGGTAGGTGGAAGGTEGAGAT
ncbi:MAG: flavodoxin-dependent (E)-4-hydroxy-3-methylbut-2-enyl-diphosphate synthase [Acidimicrobiales bacterium]